MNEIMKRYILYYNKSIVKLVGLATFFYFGLYWYFDFWYIQHQCPDAYSYQEAARYLYLENFKPHIYRPIGYPLVLGLPLLFTNDDSILSLYFHVLHYFFWIATVSFLYFFLLKIIPKFAFRLSLLFSLNIGSIALASHTITETFFTLILLTSFYFWYTYWKTNNAKYLLFSFLLFCFGVLVKPIGLYFSILFLSVIIYQFILKHHLRFIFISTLFFLLTIGLRVYKMNKYYNIQNLSTVQDSNLYLYISAYSEGIHLCSKNERAKIWQDTFKQRASVLDSIIQTEGYSKACLFARNQFIHRLKENPAAILKTYLRNVFSNSVGFSGFFEQNDVQSKRPFFSDTIILTKIITSFQNSFYSFSILLFIPFLCFQKFIKKEKFKMPWYWMGGWLFCAYLICTSGIAFASGDRLHIVIVPIALICLAVLLSDFPRFFPFSINKSQQ